METSEVIDALSALAQESRLSAFRLLVGAGPEGLAAGEIAEALGVAPATLSFHLKMLSHAGLIHSQREGRSIRYMASFDVMGELVDFLTSNCCGGDPGSCLPQRKPRRRAAAGGRR